jgi:hypothetical protein
MLIPTWLAERVEGTYADGRRFDEIGYLECKLILKPDRFTSAKVFMEFASLVRRAAQPFGIDCQLTAKSQQRPEVREVLFLDTADFLLYNNRFIIRRRIAYEDGFPIADPEIVFKFRSADVLTAHALEVRPRIVGKYKIKFKLEVMPLNDRLGGLRRLLSHNIEFGLSQAPEAAQLAMKSLGQMSLSDLARIFPPVEKIAHDRRDEVLLVNNTIVEELLQDICELDFGHGLSTTANLCLWRSRGDHHSFVGEFAFQIHFKEPPSEISHKALQACELFFIELQQVAADWLALSTTKTGALYRLKGNPPHAHE